MASKINSRPDSQPRIIQTADVTQVVFLANASRRSWLIQNQSNFPLWLRWDGQNATEDSNSLRLNKDQWHGQEDQSSVTGASISVISGHQNAIFFAVQV